MEPIEELRKEINKLHGVLVERERRNKRMETDFADLKKSVDRIVMLMDGNEDYNVIGVTDQIEELKKEVAELVKLRNQIKWAIAGVLGMTALGNAEGILTFLKTLF